MGDRHFSISGGTVLARGYLPSVLAILSQADRTAIEKLLNRNSTAQQIEIRAAIELQPIGQK